jgi:UrcA family protein
MRINVMRRYIKGKTAISCALLAMSLISLNSSAGAVEQENGVPSRRVNFADLDLTRSAGVSTLYARIKAAAAEVCEPEIQSIMPAPVQSVRRCREQAIARAIADVNAPALTSYYLAR